MTIEDLRKLDIKELEKNLEKARFDLYKIKLAVGEGTEKQNHKISITKTLIAHINTVITEKKSEAQAEATK